MDVFTSFLEIFGRHRFENLGLKGRKPDLMRRAERTGKGVPHCSPRIPVSLVSIYLRPHYELDSILNASDTSLLEIYYYLYPLIRGETEAQRSFRTCPRSHSWKGAEHQFKPRSLAANLSLNHFTALPPPCDSGHHLIQQSCEIQSVIPTVRKGN